MVSNLEKPGVLLFNFNQIASDGCNRITNSLNGAFGYNGKPSPLNCIRTSVFLASKALPHLQIKGTPAQR